MKALLVLAMLAVDGGTKPPPKCVVQTPQGPRACLPEPKPPPSCTVRVQLADGRVKTVPCKP